MIERIVDETGHITNPSAAKELITNNATMPDIDHVIFGLKTEDYVRGEDGKKIKDANGNCQMQKLEHPILATTVYFVDGTKAIVKNSLNDKVDLVQVSLNIAGEVITPTTKDKVAVKTVTVASEASKEAGIVYAIVKRILGKIGHKDKQGRYIENEMDGNGFGRVLRDNVNAAYDPVIEDAKNTLKNSIAQKLHEARQQAAKRRAEANPSLAQTVRQLSETVQNLASIVNAKIA